MPAERSNSMARRFSSGEEKGSLYRRMIELERRGMRFEREEGSLRELERNYLGLMDSEVFLFFMVDLKGTVLACNRCAERFWGVDLHGGRVYAAAVAVCPRERADFEGAPPSGFPEKDPFPSAPLPPRRFSGVDRGGDGSLSFSGRGRDSDGWGRCDGKGQAVRPQRTGGLGTCLGQLPRPFVLYLGRGGEAALCLAGLSCDREAVSGARLCRGVPVSPPGQRGRSLPL